MTVAPQAQPDTEIVSGTITGIVAKGGDKWQVTVQPDDSQYTKGLWTKDGPLVNALQQAIGSRQSFMCGASHWVRPDGQPVRSLWINGMGQEAVAPQPAPQPVAQPMHPSIQAFQQQPQVQPQVQPQAQVEPRRDQRDEKIHRQTATKVAVLFLPYLREEDQNLAGLFDLSERLVRYYEQGFAPTNPSVPADDNPPPPPFGGAPGPDDIPF